jgi:multicomponent Na+:H+ antiporter subunit D
MPWVFGAFTVASLGLIGMPGLCGFVSKQFLVRGAWEAQEITYLVIMLGGSVFTAMYLLPVVRTAYFDRPVDHGHAPEHGEKPDDAHDSQPHTGGNALSLMRWPLVATAGLVVIFGLVPAALNLQYELTLSIVRSIYGGGP